MLTEVSLNADVEQFSRHPPSATDDVGVIGVGVVDSDVIVDDGDVVGTTTTVVATVVVSVVAVAVGVANVASVVLITTSV